jgi:hypothetical protein
MMERPQLDGAVYNFELVGDDADGHAPSERGGLTSQ